MTTSAPASAVAGIDRWRGGWVIALGTTTVDSIATFDAIAEAFAPTDACEAIAIDMPIALPVSGQRDAEVQLRRVLGRAARSVFTSPTRAALHAEDQRRATEVNRANGGPGISAQAWGLTGSIRELRRELAASPRCERWFETHPETAFALLNGGSPLEAKKSARGVGRRLALLRPWCPVDALLSDAPPRVPVDDVLDAIAAWWSARRIADGCAERFGEPGRDDEGFEQSIRV